MTVQMAMSGYCLQSWRDVFGEFSVGLRRFGVMDVLRIYGDCHLDLYRIL